MAKKPVYNAGRPWRELADELHEATGDLQKYRSIMSIFEATIVTNDIKQRREMYYPVILRGVRQEWQASIDRVKAHEAAKAGAVVKESRRWDIGKLGAAMKGYEALIDNALMLRGDPMRGEQARASEEIERIYRDAVAADDIHVKRAALEVIRSATGKVSMGDRDNFVKVSQLAEQAERELRELRTPPELAQENAAQQESIAELLKMRDAVIAAGQDATGGDPTSPMASNDFAKMLRQVQQDPATGTLRLFDWDTEQVSGVRWKPEDLVVAKNTPVNLPER